MSDAVGMLKSPIVWIAGGGIGLVLLMTKSSAGSGGQTVSSAVSPAYLTASVQMNAAALGGQVELAQISADLGEAQLAADIQRRSLFYGYLKNQDDNQTILSGKQMETDAGVTTSLIASSTAIVLDQQQNANRLGLAYVDANKSAHTDNANVSIANYQYKAQKAAAKASIIGSIIGGVTKVGAAIATGGASLAVPAAKSSTAQWV